MTREKRLKAIQDMDEVIESAARTCRSYELIQMEMAVTVARAKAIHQQLITRKAELERRFEEIER
jgi:hypothetical protein